MSEDPRLSAARQIVAHVAEHLQADLSLRLWNGEVLPLGPGARADIQIAVNSPLAVKRLMLKPGLMTLFELFAENELDIVGGSPLDAAGRWDHGKAVHLGKRVDKGRLMKLAAPFLIGGKVKGAALPSFDGKVGDDYARSRDDKEMIQFHYDVGNDFYALFLDPEMVYSSAYFETHETSLEDAQLAKLDRICRKLRLQPGDRLLDLGCGWGGLVCHAAKNYGVTAHGVTLSQAQLDFVNAKIERLGLQDKVKVELRDYRTLDAESAYDKIAQVEMFEHVGFKNHDRHFQQMHRLLRPRGLYFHQASTRRAMPDLRENHKPTDTTKVITRFIFPGGELDYIGLTCTNLERLGFEVHDVENLREHFQLTLQHWEKRLYDSRDEAVSL
ncbi:MAG: class I SAM-dependent methyltransferase, partial [Caulobacteraceae bacterium]